MRVHVHCACDADEWRVRAHGTRCDALHIMHARHIMRMYMRTHRHVATSMVMCLFLLLMCFMRVRVLAFLSRRFQLLGHTLPRTQTRSYRYARITNR